ncbi:MAG: preprotein translocase subunit YajC [Flavobacteriales bacterium]|nr:preprotein translocase subunit YajC [Flavobacteriales bacterium]MCB9203426.1 preprotein translocase subunit YajC [Flavobacteriales bacterium]
MKEMMNPEVTNILFIVAMVVVGYLFFIRPQTKKAKDDRKFREELKKGDKIVTIGGIHGKIADVKESTIMLEVGDGHKLKIEKAAVSRDNSIGLQQGN